MDEPIDYTVGSTPQSVFAIPFPFWAPGDIIVRIDGETLATADYSVEGSDLQNGEEIEGAYGSGTLTLDEAVSNVTVTVDRLIEPERETDFSKTGPFSIPNLNSDLDKATARDQDILRRANLANTTAAAALATAEELTAAAFVTALDISTRARVALVTIPSWVKALNVAGYADAGDGGGGLYVWSATEPAHAGKVQSADGAWWELASQYAALEMFGGKADDSTDNYQPWRDAIYWAYLKGKPVIPNRLGGYLFAERVRESAAPIEYPVLIQGASRQVQLKIECSNVSEGMHVLASDVTIQGLRITAKASSSIVNGSGNNGTCLSVQRWFVPPDQDEPMLIKNVIIRDNTFDREGNFNGHAISVLSRAKHGIIENNDFVGNGPAAASGYHGDAVLFHWGAWSHGVSTHAIDYDAQTAAFTPGAIVTGATSGASAYIVVDEDAGTTGTLRLKLVLGTFTDNEVITDSAGGAAVVNGSMASSTVQSRFEPGHYSHHPSTWTLRNNRCENVGRFIACSASYSIDVIGVEYTGPVQGGQLVDLPVGDEADTFAHPEDRGRVYDGFSFKRIRSKGLTGTGINAVTAIDDSGYSTSKQSDADLAGYADSEYDGTAYGGQAYSRWRQPEWKNVVFEGFTFDYGPADPPSATVVERVIYLRNMRGNFTFRDFWMEARENADRSGTPDPVIGGIELANCLGRYTFENIKSAGHLIVNGVDRASFTDCEFKHREIVSGTRAIELMGAEPTITTDGSTYAIGATEIGLNAAVSGVNILIGDPLLYSGGVVYAEEFVLSGGGQTTVKVTPLPTAATAGTVFTIDHRNRSTIFRGVIARQGSRGYDISDSVGVMIDGGEVIDSGQYGTFIDTGAQVVQTGTIFSNGGQRRATIPADSALATRDVIMAGGHYTGRNLRFENSKFIAVNFVVSSTATFASLSESVFVGTPITAKTQIAALSSGDPVFFSRNTDATGGAVFLSGTWTPQLELGGGTTGMSLAINRATFTVYEDRVAVDYDFTLSAKGSSTGAATVSGLPYPTAAGSVTSAGSVGLISASGLAGGACFTRIVSGEIGIYQQTATTLAAVQHSEITDTTRIIGSCVYQRVA
ncbi:hypothetical protein IWC96_14390 [Brevundimonas sp. BAL450]|uniref:hypothetical protein n=1 Tax=Brevundimonas sp. BAL450 TaxID=1708162 RepID=UPI0018C960E5|nr:hypothetical protein [Brevundimonas sp. BAL450]MBG7616463.1 hypothetical protein [Brevundimonas sp. BAL450]